MPETYAYLLKWGPGAGCSPSPFTRATFRPTDSILANLLGANCIHQCIEVDMMPWTAP